MNLSLQFAALNHFYGVSCMSVSSVTPGHYGALSSPLLHENGLNMQAVFDLCELPAAMQERLSGEGAGPQHFRQLLLFGNGGTRFWQRFLQSEFAGDDPVDAFSLALVQGFMATELPGVRYQVIYPGAALVPLQELGRLAGWHHDSPLKVGINDCWGLWYAYRVVVVADSDLPVSTRVDSRSPCVTCEDKPCVRSCPAEALAGRELRLERCLDHRTADGSSCAGTCLARMACPVAPEHRYSADQIDYHYRFSLAHIVAWRARGR